MALPAGRYGVTKAMLDYLASGGGGGDFDIFSEDVEVSASEATKITLGYKPELVIVYGTNGSNFMFFVYYEMWHDNKQIRNWKFSTYDETTQLWAIPYTGSEHNAIKSIDSDGFTLMPYDASSYAIDGKVSILALKKKS